MQSFDSGPLGDRRTAIKPPVMGTLAGGLGAVILRGSRGLDVGVRSAGLHDKIMAAKVERVLVQVCDLLLVALMDAENEPSGLFVVTPLPTPPVKANVFVSALSI